MTELLPKLTVENICDACELKPVDGCDEPCDIWYRCLQGEQISWEEILKGK